MQHAISYDLARGLHIIAAIAWMSGMLMLPRFYASITALAPNDSAVETLLRSARHARTVILAPSMTLTWAIGIFLFLSYFASDWDAPFDSLAKAPLWFWGKLALALVLTAYHGMLVTEGRRLASGERRRSERFWKSISVLPFLVAVVVVLLATIEP